MTTKNIRLLLLQGSVLLLAACAVTSVNLPAVSDSPTVGRLPGKIIWHDLLTNDPGASQRFYGELFGWEFEAIGIASGLKGNITYTLIRHHGQLIGGMIDTKALNNRTDMSQWVVLTMGMPVAAISISTTGAPPSVSPSRAVTLGARKT